MLVIDMNCVFVGMNFFGFVVKIFVILIVWNDVCVIKNVLNCLIDCELDDIGLCCGDIELIVCC